MNQAGTDFHGVQTPLLIDYTVLKQRSEKEADRGSIQEPSDVLNHVRRLYPKLHAQAYDVKTRFQNDTLAGWPSFCFLPTVFWTGLVAQRTGTTDSKLMKQFWLQISTEANLISALGTWQYTRGVYDIDKEVMSALLRSGCPEKVPVGVLSRLPEWCLYVRTPGWHLGVEPIEGFWVLNDYLKYPDMRKGGVRGLNFRVNSASYTDPVFLPIDGNCTLEEAIDEASKFTAEIDKANGTAFDEALDYKWRWSSKEFLNKAIPILLYICSDEPDIDDERKPGSRPEMPQPRRMKKGWRLFPATNDRVWTVGAKVGATLREAAAKEYQGGTKRPHLRRGHWHGYWTGPRTSEQKFSYRWIAPTVVSGAL